MDIQESNIEKLASKDFEKARFKAALTDIFSAIKKDKSELLSFEVVRQALKPTNQTYKGVHPIPIDKIVGSEGRYKDFNRNFLPKIDNIKDRWTNVDKAHYKNIELPPIQVYKIGDAYFVKDGNHRVSVARQQGKKFIDAEIIELKTKVAVDKDIDYYKLIIKEEYLKFLENTHIDEILPDVKFEVTKPGRYDILLEQIRFHHYLLNTLSGKEVSWEEAVKSWYKTIYLPIIQLIHKHKIMKHFSGLTETDLYIWIINHWNFLKEHYDDSINTEQAAIHLKEHYSNYLSYRLKNYLKNGIKKVTNAFKINNKKS